MSRAYDIRVEQRKHGGPITHRSQDQNLALIHFSINGSLSVHLFRHPFVPDVVLNGMHEIFKTSSFYNTLDSTLLFVFVFILLILINHLNGLTMKESN